MKNSKLADALNRLGPVRYAKIENPEDAAALANMDLVAMPDIPGELPDDDMPCKMFATDFFRLAAKYAPELVNERAVENLCERYHVCIPNGATQLNIIIILGLLKRRDRLPFLKQIVEDNRQHDWHKAAAAEAIKVIQGELEIGQGNFSGRWIYI